MAANSTGIPPPASSADAQRNQRYVYLVGRLHNRQMTMEEATELFGIMQGMLRQSEAARQAVLRSLPSPSAPGAKERPAPAPSAASGSDDFFLLGILAMGAGAGLLAAMTKRLQELTPAAGTVPPSRGAGGSAAP